MFSIRHMIMRPCNFCPTCSGRWKCGASIEDECIQFQEWRQAKPKALNDAQGFLLNMIILFLFAACLWTAFSWLIGMW